MNSARAASNTRDMVTLERGGRVATVDAGSVRVAQPAQPKAIGAQVAARVAGGLAGGGKR